MSVVKSELFKSSMENLEWFKRNYENIRKDCDNQWVVIQNKKVVAKASTYENIARTLKKEDKKSAMIEFIDSNQLAMFF
jgi:predicted RNA-binding protein